MDPEFSEDEFDRLLRDEAVPDAILRAADLLENGGVGNLQIIEADEYDIMLADDISGDILLACDEAERVASLSEMLLQRKGDDPNPLWWYPRDFLPRRHPSAISQIVVVNSTTRNLSYWGSPISISSDGSSDEESRDSCSTPETSQIASSSVRSSSAATNSRASVFLPLDDNMNVSAELVYDSLAARPRFYLPANAVKTAPNPAPGTSQPTLKRKFHADSWEEPRPPKKAKPINHLALFFARYPRFSYDPHAPYGDAKSEREVAYAGYQRAMALSFGASYGTDVNDLGSLQSLARVLEIDPIPQRVRTVKRRFARSTSISSTWSTGANSEGQSPPPTIFKTLDDLQVYTKKTRKFFPQGRAEDTLLKFFAAACFMSGRTSPARVNTLDWHDVKTYSDLISLRAQQILRREELLTPTLEKLTQSCQQSIENMNRRMRYHSFSDFEPGMWVWRHETNLEGQHGRKEEMHWSGPFIIHKAGSLDSEKCRGIARASLRRHYHTQQFHGGVSTLVTKSIILPFDNPHLTSFATPTPP
ncbi:hypothetical protein B0H14DRAFT_3892160 [Mycena olivaceomarginata]|nr:hypothetical protein B0H14DRAFT_3892160 [Mycena olivaceomarginata]